MGNLFSQSIPKKPADRFSTKKQMMQVEQHSAIIGDRFFNVEDARMVALESGLLKVDGDCDVKKHNCSWIDLRLVWELVRANFPGFLKKEEQFREREGKSNVGLDEVFEFFKVEENEFFYGGNSLEILVTHKPSNIKITREVLQCLLPGAWLNDEVINLYLELLKEREKREPEKFLTCHFFNTFFLKKLISGRNGYDFSAVRRWTIQEKLGYTLNECDKIFVPIHKDVHWCLGVIDVKDKTFQYLDSLGGTDTQVLEVLAKYFMDEAWDKVAKEVDTTSWKRESVHDLPLQLNGWDCGMFMLKYIDFYSKGLKPHFCQDHIAWFRKVTAMEILRLTAE